MKLILVIAVLASCAAGCAAAGEDGFVSLFNGRDLSGWVVKGNAAAFRVEDGCMVSDGGLGGEWIRSEKPYSNFVLRMDWMLSKTGNSGILIR